MQSLALVDDWPVEHVAVGVVGADGTVRGTRGDTARRFPLASVTKPLVAWAALVAVEEEAVTLDQPAGPEGSTVRHLLAHTSGLAFDEHRVVAEPGTQRVYSSAGFEVLAATIEDATGIAFTDYLDEALLAPLGMTSTTLDGSPGHGATSSVDDLLCLAAEMQAPTLLDPATAQEARTVQFPGLNGLVPGFGQQKPNDWGLGVELRDGKSPHWTGSRNAPGTFGHFGRSGTFLWVDPDAGAACVVLTDREFEQWAKDAWPSFSDAVLAEL